MIESNKEAIEHPDNIIESVDKDDETLTYGMTVGHEGIDILKGLTVNMYYNATLRNQVICNHMSRVRKCKTDLEHGIRKKGDARIYKDFLVETKDEQGNVTVAYNDAAINKYKKTAGYWLMADAVAQSAKEALELYRKRNFDEVSFDDIKNSSDLKRLRTHNGGSTDGKLFIMFIAQIIRQALRTAVLNIDIVKRRYMNYKEMLRWVASYSETHFEGKTKAAYSTPSKHQRLIFDLLNLPYYYKGKMHNDKKDAVTTKSSTQQDKSPEKVESTGPAS